MRKIITNWLGPHRDVRLLQIVTFLRSIVQGMALVDISLFLKSMGWSGGAIGGMLAGAGIVRTILSLFAKEVNGWLGSKRYLFYYESLTVLAMLVVVVTSNPIALTTALILAGLGTGHSGSGGPTSPIERAWLAAYARHDSRRLFHQNALVGYLGMGVGALLACLPALWRGMLSGSSGYRPVFVIMIIVSVGCMFVISKLKGGKRKPRVAPQAADPSEPSAPSARLRDDIIQLGVLIAGCMLALGASAFLRGLGKVHASLYLPIVFFLVLILIPIIRQLAKRKSATSGTKPMEELKFIADLLSGVTTTLTSSMTSYWFTAKFDASPGWVAVVMGVSYLAAAVLSKTASANGERHEAVRSVMMLQVMGIAFLLILPWTPSFWIAAVLEIGCTACNLGTRGNRTAIMMEDRGKHKRSWVAKINYLIIRVGAVLWPGAFGQFIDEGQFVAPFYLAAAIKSGAALLYAKVYQRPRVETPTVQ